MEYLAEQLHLIAVLAEVFGQRDPIASQEGWPGEIDRFGSRRITAQQERDATGIAQRKLTVGPLEADAVAGQAVQVRRLHQRIAVAVNAAVQVVHGDEEHIGPALRGRRLDERRQAAGYTHSETKGESGFHRRDFRGWGTNVKEKGRQVGTPIGGKPSYRAAHTSETGRPATSIGSWLIGNSPPWLPSTTETSPKWYQHSAASCHPSIDGDSGSWASKFSLACSKLLVA